MTRTFYQQLAANALLIVQQAIAEAEATLPWALRKAHRMLMSRQELEPWNTVKHQYETVTNSSAEVTATLLHLVHLDRAAVNLRRVRDTGVPPPVSSLNLQLARTRRTA